MMRAAVIGGSLGGLTAALILRDQGWDVEVLERSPNRLEGRGTGIVLDPTTVRYLVERAGKSLDDISLPAQRLQYLDGDGSIVDEQPCAYRFASYGELYRGLLDAFGTEHYHLSNELAHLDDLGDAATLTLTGCRAIEADLVVCADGVHSTGRRIMLPNTHPYAVHCWRGPSTLANSAAERRTSCWARTPTESCRAATCWAVRFPARRALCCSTGSGIRASRRGTTLRTCSPTATVPARS